MPNQKNQAKITNREIADILYEVADDLEIKGEGLPYKPRAYRRAAQSIETLPEDITKLYEENRLTEIPGVGVSIAEKIREIIETGHLKYLEELEKKLPQGLRDLMKIEGLGPKRALKLYEALKIKSIGDLEAAARSGKIRELEEFGEKTEKNILDAIELYRRAHERFLLGFALPIALDAEKRLKGFKQIEKISLAGSIRRRKETVHDIDILAASGKPRDVVDFFTKMPGVKRVLAKGDTKSTVLLANSLRMDIRVVQKESFGSALQYLTGSKEHNIKLRDLALGRNMKLSEYGLFDKNKGKKIAGETEEGVYKALGLQYIEPELRENMGEIEAAQKGKLPKLIQYNEIKGDLHVHSNRSEGANTMEEMAATAKSMGYEYTAMTDHTRSLKIARGMTDNKLKEQIKEIDRINQRLEEFTILKGVEANIDADGKIDVPNNILKDLDIVLASIHSGFKQSKEKITGRILSAMHNDYVNVIAHPTGRLLTRRAGYEIDLPKVFEEASKLGVFMEINAFPDRLDLSDVNCFNARKHGVKFSIGTDAHSKDHLRFMEFGVSMARRGWLEKKDVINTLDLKELRKQLK